MESVLSKMSPFSGRTILFVDALNDRTEVVACIKELGLQSFVAKDVSEAANKEQCPHIDTVLVDSLNVVSGKEFGGSP